MASNTTSVQRLPSELITKIFNMYLDEAYESAHASLSVASDQHSTPCVETNRDRPMNLCICCRFVRGDVQKCFKHYKESVSKLFAVSFAYRGALLHICMSHLHHAHQKKKDITLSIDEITERRKRDRRQPASLDEWHAHLQADRQSMRTSGLASEMLIEVATTVGKVKQDSRT